MRLTLEIDTMHHEIDSTDPEILGRWVVEIFARYRVGPQTLIRMQAMPSYLPGGPGEPMRPDWIADGRIMGLMREVRSPRDLVAELGRQIELSQAKK